MIVLAAMRVAAPLLVPLLLTLMVVLATTPPILRLQQRGISPRPAIPGFYVVLVGLGLVLLIYFGILMREFSQNLPEYEADLQTRLTAMLILLVSPRIVARIPDRLGSDDRVLHAFNEFRRSIVDFCVISMAVSAVLGNRVVRRRLDLSGATIFLGAFFWAWVLGPAGALPAAPIMALVKVVLESSPQTHWLAVLMSARYAEPSVGERERTRRLGSRIIGSSPSPQPSPARGEGPIAGTRRRLRDSRPRSANQLRVEGTWVNGRCCAGWGPGL